jgi:hypothetical protein
VVDQVLAERDELDPEPGALRFLDCVRRTDLASLLRAGWMLDRAVVQLRKDLGGVTRWPAQGYRWETEAGLVVVGTAGNDRYEGPFLLVVEPCGDDVYAGPVGAARGLTGLPVAVTLDLEGDDRYVGGKLLGPGCALFGVAVLADVQGDDLYRAEGAGQGGAVFGCAVLRDGRGDDVYRAYGMAQGAALMGVGFLCDDAGDDLYDVGLMGQGFAGVSAVGLHLDRQGNDVYIAGGVQSDLERHDDRYVSLAQGASLGMRPFAGGGYGILADLGGNDSYQADIFGQGVGYWYSVGLLLDGSGHDRYQVHHYGQGSGIHMAAGLLADLAGDDMYTGYVLAQGNAHDYAVGMLLDHGGDDTYTADHHAQGRALNNGVALLVDRSGSDAYFGRQSDQCQGVGNDGGEREYGSIAVLMDLAGEDRYTCGAGDGARLLRPDFGIVYDLDEEAAGEP